MLNRSNNRFEKMSNRSNSDTRARNNSNDDRERTLERQNARKAKAFRRYINY